MESKDPSTLGEAEKLVENVLTQAKLELEKKEGEAAEVNGETNHDSEDEVKRKLLDELPKKENEAEKESAPQSDATDNGHPVNGTKGDAENSGKNGGVNGKDHANGANGANGDGSR